MIELPLFPLQTVLFPGAPLRLHIFEERYKLMINQCIQHKQPFGVVLIRSGLEAMGPLAEPHRIGTIARIIQVQRLPDGRMNIAAIGEERFKIVSLEPDIQPYLVGYVEPLELDIANVEMLAQAGSKLHRRVERYFLTLSESGAGQFDLAQFPEDPVRLAYLSASLLQMNDIQKQAILAQPRAEDLLNAVNDAYRREIALLKAITFKDHPNSGAFSLN
ncbi:MAG: LON peptidase substrate-binding domain-containing protein [Anaerolineales bacterium]|jgi:Lon protease-like protein|nr:LON peptidase substrate-binding domain-containing protein [Anaerolineales bacterium]